MLNLLTWKPDNHLKGASRHSEEQKLPDML
jgi:hypothetical protein